MGQAPATGQISLRTVPRNFPGRSGTKEDQVYLCSPETATASALTGVITDPRTLPMSYPRFTEPEKILLNVEMMLAPPADGSKVELEKGPNIHPLPDLDPLPTFSDPQHWKAFEQGDFLRFSDLKAQLQHGDTVEVMNLRTEQKYRLVHHMSSRQIETILAGGLICLTRQRVYGAFGVRSSEFAEAPW